MGQEGRGGFQILLQSDDVLARFTAAEHIVAIIALMEKYADIPMSFADASLVRMSEIHGKARVMTCDSDFSIYRKNGRQSIPLIAPWK